MFKSVPFREKKDKVWLCEYQTLSVGGRDVIIFYVFLIKYGKWFTMDR